MIKIKKLFCFFIAAALLTVPVSAMPSRVIITDYFVDGGGFVAGQVSTVTFILKNTNSSSNITSVFLVGWIDSGSPVEFAETNQAYVEMISPGGEVEVVFEYYTKNVDMTAIRSVSVGFYIYYSDNALGDTERSNSVSLRLPVLRGARTTIAEEDMRWSAPMVSNIDNILSSDLMQAVYIAVFVVCVLWSILLVLFRFGILKRRF